MEWKSVGKETPPLAVEIRVSYIPHGMISQQKQTCAKYIGKDQDKDLIWLDLHTSQYINKTKFTVTHWMNSPDNPMVV